MKTTANTNTALDRIVDKIVAEGMNPENVDVMEMLREETIFLTKIWEAVTDGSLDMTAFSNHTYERINK